MNTLLSAMNERIYKGRPIPLRMLVGASNELPEEEVLAAVYDRFLLRDVVSYVQADATWMQLLGSPPRSRRRFKSRSPSGTRRAPTSTRSRSPRIIQEMLRVRNDLKTSGLVVSDRRWMALTRVLRAAAWLDDSPEVELDHLPVLRFGLWQKVDERARVVSVLETVDRSAVAKAVDLVDAGLRSYARRPTDAAEYLAAVPRLADEITEAGKRVQEMLKGGVSRRAHARIQPKLDELKKVHDALKSDLARRYAL